MRGAGVPEGGGVPSPGGAAGLSSGAPAGATSGLSSGATAGSPPGSSSGLRRVNPPELSPPAGFSHAVTVTGGRLVFLAGQTALDASGRIVPGGLPEQFERALGNLLGALAAAGGAPQHLARVTVYATDVAAYRAHARELGTVWRRLAGRDYPAMAVVGVVRLWDEEALVELDGIAVVQ